MRVLGIYAGHDSSAAVVEDGKVIIAIEEERLTGIKKQGGIPARAIMYICKSLGCSPWDFDKVMVATPNLHSGRTHAVDTNSVLAMYPNATLVPHHEAHAALAYAWSGWDECTVLTLDGGGEDYFGSVNHCKDGKMNRIDSLRKDEDEAFGMLYYHVTEALGFRPNRHEGKVMGLAAHGRDMGFFNGLFRADGTKIKSSGKHEEDIVDHRLIALSKYYSPQDFTVENVAASCQAAFEEVVLEWVKNNTVGSLAVSGGCFANVLTNMKIDQMLKDRGYCYYVTPPMADDGLSIGAALCAFDRIPVKRQEHMYLGLPDKYYTFSDDEPKQAAKAISEGRIIGLFQGAMEFGPRALGNRTILADARDARINKTLNDRLNRTEFMPFAPVILEEYASEILYEYDSDDDNAPFMTTCYKVYSDWISKIPAVVHKDGTARPQVLKRETNPFYYDIIDEYRKLTGIPVLINTSFNGHEEPIICFENEAQWALQTGKIDILVRG